MNTEKLKNRNSSDTVVCNVSNDGASKKVNQRGRKNIFYIVLKRARKLYDDQLDKSACSLYSDCILKVISNTKGITEAEFKARFAEIVIDLLDRNTFITKCKKRKLSPYVIATHLAAMTSSQRKEILENMDLIPEKVLSCGTPIFEMKDLKDIDRYKVISEATDITFDKK